MPKFPRVVPGGALWIALVLTLFTVRLCADTIELKTGERIDGVIRQSGPKEAVIEVAGQPITIPVDKVRAIYFGKAPKAAEKASLARDALVALQALQSVTTSGISYLQYAPRVLDARVKVDQYLNSPAQSDEAVRGSVALAMRYYELAARTWGNAIRPAATEASTSEFTSRLLASAELVKAFQSQELSACPVIKKAQADAMDPAAWPDSTTLRLKNPPGSDPSSYALAMLFLLSGTELGKFNPTPGLWSCASDKIVEAEKALASGGASDADPERNASRPGNGTPPVQQTAPAAPPKFVIQGGEGSEPPTRKKPDTREPIAEHAVSTPPEAEVPPTAPATPEPEFSDVFYGLQANMLLPLERQAGSIRGKASGYIVLNSTGVLDFPGGKSPIRFRAGQPLEFIVRSGFARSTVDPSSVYWLRKVTAKGDRREIVLVKGHAALVWGSMNTHPTEGVLPVEFSRYGATSYKLRASLPPGEYALSRAGARDVFCFGVD